MQDATNSKNNDIYSITDDSHFIFVDGMSLATTKIPVTTNHITFHSKFNEIIMPSIIPASVQEINFGDEFNQSLMNVLPSGLKKLHFGERFNVSINNKTLPASLEELYFGADFNQEIGSGVLPLTLTTIHFGSRFDRILKPGTIPTNINCLFFDNPDTYLEPNMIPLKLRELRIADKLYLISCHETIRYKYEKIIMEKVANNWNMWYKNIGNTSDKFFITTAINYMNGKPHIGHAYEIVYADVIARYNRICGLDVFFLTGADEHGQKISSHAKSLGITPKKLCDMNVHHTIDLNVRLAITNDEYIRTSDEKHAVCANRVATLINERGDIYLDKYIGWYNLREETFVSQHDAESCNYIDTLSGNPLINTECESYFFRMSRYQSQIITHIKSNPEFIQPVSQRDFILQRLESPLHDLSISRTNFDWGIHFNFDPHHVMYVWFDALTNYLTGIDWLHNQHYWSPDIQIIGKDICWFHAVVWLAMLFALCIEKPRTILCHGFINDEHNIKMSKSLNNIIDPLYIIDKYNSDALRLYFVASTVMGQDLAFSEVSCYNSDFINTTANLVNRLLSQLSMIDGQIPDTNDHEIIFEFHTIKISLDTHMLHHEIGSYYKSIMSTIHDINTYMTQKQPWKINNINYKKTVLRTIAESIYFIMHYMSCVVPKLAHDVFIALGTNPKCIHKLNNGYNLIPATPVAKKFYFVKF